MIFALRFLLSFGLLVYALPSLWAQHPFRFVETYGKEVGIQGVNSLAQDNQGFLWIGTWNGLFRFDGLHTHKVFLTPEGNQTFQSIFDLVFDSVTNTLGICANAGVGWYDLNTKQFEYFKPAQYAPPNEITKGNECLFQDRQGDWWGNFNTLGLTRFNLREKKVERFVLPLAQLQVEGSYSLANTVLSLTQDVLHDSIIWAGTRYGLIRLNKDHKTMSYFRYNTPNAALDEVSNAMICLLSHPNGRLYIGTWDGGILEFDHNTRQFRQHLPAPQHSRKQLTRNRVYTLLPHDGNAIWIGCGMGIGRFDPLKQTFELVKENAALHFQDKNGDFWGFKDGLVRYNRFRNQIPVVPTPGGELKEIRTDPSGQEIFLKKFGQSGVVALDPASAKTRLIPFPRKKALPADGDVLEFTSMGLIANDMEQLYLLPNGGKNFMAMGIQLPAGAGWLNSEALPDGGAVLSGNRGYLIHFKPGDPQPDIYPPEAVGGGITGMADGLYVLSTDAKGRVWARTSAGFVIFDPGSRQFQRFAYQNMPDKIISDIREFRCDSKGRMWCAGPTELGWMDVENPAMGIIKKYDTSNGFTFREIKGLLTDQGGSIWFHCDKGLVRFFPDHGTFRIYPTDQRAMAFLPDGRLSIRFFDSGVTIIHPDSLQTDTLSPRPYANWFKVLDKEKLLSGSAFAPDEVRLAPHENFISIGLSALGFFRQADYQFAYQLVGVNKDWVLADAENLVAAYTALDGGSYLFRLKVRDATGRWSEQPFELRIYIATPWYRSWPAWISYAVLLVLAGRWWLRYRDQQLLVQQRLREEQREAERLKELDHFKNRFFTNITHEFRTPLTVILGVSSELETEAQTAPAHDLKSKLLDAIPFIRRNGQRLLHLVNQMLELARLDAGNLSVHLTRGDVMDQLRILLDAFHSYAVSQKIELQFQADPEHFEMDFDPELLQRIVSNLLSNALKFTAQNGYVRMSANVVTGHETLLIVVQDSGIGIPEKDIPHIFDRFYEGAAVPLRGEESSGIGLALVKEIVTLLHGRIEVESKVGSGSTFRVLLPVTKNATPETLSTLQMPEVPDVVQVPESTEETLGSAQPLALAIEDNADVLSYLSACLLPDWEVITARDGTTGLSLAQERLPDVIISDVMMPGMDGFELTEALKSDVRTSHIPVLLLTAKSTKTDILEGLSKGADDYLVKPFDKAELLLRLRNFHQRQLRWQNKLFEAATPDDPLPTAERAFLNQVDTAIEARLDDADFKAEHLARAVAMSRVQLYRKLTALTGLSTGLYIRRYRLQRAKQLLARTDLTVSEVAWKVGFESMSWFSQAFREEFGESPRHARKS